MRADDFVTTGSELEERSSSLVSNITTDAVSTGIVGSADKSRMALKRNVLDETGTDSHGRHQIMTESTVNKAAGMAKDVGGRVAADRLVSSATGAQDEKLISRRNIKKSVRNAAVGATLQDSEFEGLDSYYYRVKDTAKLGKAGAKKAKEAAEKRAAKKKKLDVSGGADNSSKLGGLSEKKYARKKTPDEIQRKMQSQRNQRRAMQSLGQSKGTTEAVKSAKAMESVIAKGSSSSAALAFGGIGGTLLSVVGLVLVGLLFLAIVAGAASSNSTDANTDGLSEGDVVLVQELQKQGFTLEAIAGILGNTGNEGKPDSDVNMDGKFNYRYERACGMFQYTHASQSTPPSATHNCEYCRYKRYCAKNNKDWRDPVNQVEWTFGGKGGSSWKGRWMMRSTQYLGYWKSKYPWLKKSTLCKASDFKKITDPAVAAYCWMAGYEGCAYGEAAHLDRRIESAKKIYAQLKSGVTNDVEINENSNKFVKRAAAERGKPYVYGATGPNAYDCSGLVGYAIKGKHVRWCTTGTITNQQSGFKKIDKSKAKPGDIVCNSHHCGIYIGNGKMIHAPHTGEVVKVSKVHSGMGYYRYTK